VAPLKNVVSTVVSNVFEKEIGKGKAKTKTEVTSWQIKAFSIRKLDRKESAPASPSAAAGQSPTDEETRY
jgi:hypothetical protein